MLKAAAAPLRAAHRCSYNARWTTLHLSLEDGEVPCRGPESAMPT